MGRHSAPGRGLLAETRSRRGLNAAVRSAIVGAMRVAMERALRNRGGVTTVQYALVAVGVIAMTATAVVLADSLLR
jgi:hypothetical protein